MKFDFATLLHLPNLADQLKEVSGQLERAIASGNPCIQEPAKRLFDAGSKRLRPSLAIAVAASQGAAISGQVLAGAAAVELIHLASLVHDDIIDEADTRWNIPTVNSQEGLEDAILVGDYLFAKACAIGATVDARLAEMLAEAIVAIADGESRETADQHNVSRTVASYLQAVHGKTATLLSVACQTGGLCAGLDSVQVAALGRYGENFGMAFQLVDDVLDFISTPELLGKPVDNDVREGVYTMPLLLTLETAKDDTLQNKLQSDILQDGATLADTLLQNGTVAQTLQAAQKYNQTAVQSLEIFTDSAGMQGLRDLPDAYLQWALDNLVNPKYRAALA